MISLVLVGWLSAAPALAGAGAGQPSSAAQQLRALSGSESSAPVPEIGPLSESDPRSGGPQAFEGAPPLSLYLKGFFGYGAQCVSERLQRLETGAKGSWTLQQIFVEPTLFGSSLGFMTPIEFSAILCPKGAEDCGPGDTVLRFHQVPGELQVIPDRVVLASGWIQRDIPLQVLQTVTVGKKAKRYTLLLEAEVVVQPLAR